MRGESHADYASFERPVQISFIAHILNSDVFKKYLDAEGELIREIEAKSDPEYFPVNEAIGTLGKAINKFTVAKFVDWKSSPKK